MYLKSCFLQYIFSGVLYQIISFHHVNLYEPSLSVPPQQLGWARRNSQGTSEEQRALSPHHFSLGCHLIFFPRHFVSFMQDFSTKEHAHICRTCSAFKANKQAKAKPRGKEKALLHVATTLRNLFAIWHYLVHEIEGCGFPTLQVIRLLMETPNFQH